MSDTNAGTAPAAPAANTAQDKDDEHFTHENFPEQTPGQLSQLRRGKLPGEMKLQAVTLILGLMGTILGVTGIAMHLM